MNVKDSVTCTSCACKLSRDEARCPRCHEPAPTRTPRPVLLEELTAEPGAEERPRGWLKLAGSPAAVEIDRPLVVGRSSGADIKLASPSLSRRHALFLGEGRSFRVIDLGSRNGVYVNEVLAKDHELAEGDVIRLDVFEFVFTFREPTVAA